MRVWREYCVVRQVVAKVGAKNRFDHFGQFIANHSRIALEVSHDPNVLAFHVLHYLFAFFLQRSSDRVFCIVGTSALLFGLTHWAYIHTPKLSVNTAIIHIVHLCGWCLRFFGRQFATPVRFPWHSLEAVLGCAFLFFFFSWYLIQLLCYFFKLSFLFFAVVPVKKRLRTLKDLRLITLKPFLCLLWFVYFSVGLFATFWRFGAKLRSVRIVYVLFLAYLLCLRFVGPVVLFASGSFELNSFLHNF